MDRATSTTDYSTIRERAVSVFSVNQLVENSLSRMILSSELIILRRNFEDELLFSGLG